MLKKNCKSFAIIIQFAEQKYSVKHVLKEGNPENLNQLMFSILNFESWFCSGNQTLQFT